MKLSHSADNSCSLDDYLVTVANQQSFWHIDEPLWADLARRVLSWEMAPKASEMCLTFVSKQKIAELNLTHMGRNEPTDVLAFPIDDSWLSGNQSAGPAPHPPRPDPCLLGDVVISPEVAYHNAIKYRHSPNSLSRPVRLSQPDFDDTSAEIALLVVHGTLHVCGYDHDTTEAHDLMFELQQTYLANYFSGMRQLPLATQGSKRKP